MYPSNTERLTDPLTPWDRTNQNQDGCSQQQSSSCRGLTRWVCWEDLTFNTQQSVQFQKSVWPPVSVTVLICWVYKLKNPPSPTSCERTRTALIKTFLWMWAIVQTAEKIKHLLNIIILCILIYFQIVLIKFYMIKLISYSCTLSDLYLQY